MENITIQGNNIIIYDGYFWMAAYDSIDTEFLDKMPEGWKSHFAANTKAAIVLRFLCFCLTIKKRYFVTGQNTNEFLKERNIMQSKQLQDQKRFEAIQEYADKVLSLAADR